MIARLNPQYSVPAGVDGVKDDELLQSEAVARSGRTKARAFVSPLGSPEAGQCER